MIGYELAHKAALKAVKARRLGSIPGCAILNCADIGVATLQNGRQVYTTWGRNLNPVQQKWYAEETGVELIWFHADDGSCELILPEHIANAILPILKF